MIKVSGCLSSLFIYKNQPMIDFDLEFERLAKSLINKPITNNGEECIGVITDVDIENDIWNGYLFKTDLASLDINRRTSMSINIVKMA